MRQLQLFPNPSTPIAGAAAGAFVGSLAGSFVGALLSLTSVVKGTPQTPLTDAQIGQRASRMTNGFAAIGAATGAYIGAQPHQRVLASVGALVGGASRALLWDATAGHATFEDVMKRWYVSIPVGLLPTGGAALGAWGAGRNPLALPAPSGW